MDFASFFFAGYRAGKSILLWLSVLAFLFPALPIRSETQKADVGLKTQAEPLDSGFFFGEASENEGVYENAFAKEDATESSGVSEEAHNGQDRWVDEDISPMFPELKIIDELSTKHSLRRMRMARRFYAQAKKALRLAQKKAQRERARFSLEGARYDWEKIDRKESLKRRERRILHKGRLEAISYLIKGIRELDALKNPTILKSDSYTKLKASMYRSYVKQQFKNRNLNLCIDILERYMRLKPEYEQEPEAHRLLAASYRSQEILADRARDLKARLRFKKLKNKHLLAYALLAYGKDSHQYKFIKQKVEQDMLDVALEER